MKNILAENMRRFRTKNLNEQELPEQTQKWPRWNANITEKPSGMYYAAAGRLDDIGYFVMASALFDQLKRNLESDGWVETKPNEIQFNNWNKWQQSHSTLMAVVDKYKLQVEDNDKTDWEKNVIPNIKGGAWESADKKQTVYASTWNSFDEWLDTGTNGLLVRACSTSAANYASCNAKPVAYNGGKLQL